MNDKFTITLNVVGADLSLTIPRNEEEEELVRAAVRLINRKADQYRNRCAESDRDNHDFLAMAACQIAREYLKVIRQKDVSPFEVTIDRLTKQLDAYLNETTE